MSKTLPRLRMNLEFMPSPVADRPGLLIRDPFKYSDATLIVPPPLVPYLEFFNGENSELDLRAALVSATGDLRVGEILDNLNQALGGAGFFDDDSFARLRRERHEEFARARVRRAAFAGSAYPDDPVELNAALEEFFEGEASARNGLLGIAAPHVSLEGGWESYCAAYRTARQHYDDRTFVILGTSHYGEAERFGITRKPFLTPLGETRTDASLGEWLACQSGPAAIMEDYCHSIEHSIEFQVIFLQHLYGPGIRILPILCGPFARSIYEGGMPEDNDAVKAFLNALGELAEREGNRLFWVLGIDMAHMGRRYGDPFSSEADRGNMAEVAAEDRRRIDRIIAGDAKGFWELVQQKKDPLKWCGASPLYTFLKAVPKARGKLLHYKHWNIDPESVVSFGAIAFERES